MSFQKSLAEARPVTKALRHDGIMPSIPGADYVQMARGESGKKSEVTRSPH